MTPDPRVQKAQLRTTILAARQGMTAAQRGQAGEAIARHGLAQWRGIGSIAAYLSMRDEPRTDALLDGLIASGSRVLLPVIDGLALDWAEYNGSRTVTPGPLGISEPIGARLGTDAVLQADAVVVPALAADRHGNRLGRGRGFYDRTLLDVAAPIVAVVYDAELIEDVPIEAHDQRVGAVLRPAGFTSLS